MLQRLDERTPCRVGNPGAARFAAGQSDELGVELCPLGRVCRQQHGSTKGPRLAEQRTERRAHLLGPERLVLEQGQLPAVECLGKRTVDVGEPEAEQQLGREAAPEGVETARLARRLGRGDRQNWTDAERAPVEGLEQHRPGRDGRRRREPDGADGIGDLRRRVGRILPARKRGPKVENAVPIGFATEVARHQRGSLRPVTSELAVGHRPDPQPGGELELRRHRDAEQRRNGRVAATLPVERALELRVGAIEGLVVPVEAAARLRGRREQSQEDGAEERLALGRARPGMGAREDPGCRLAPELLEGDDGVVADAEPRSTLLDEGPDERPVLVERRPTGVLVLDEGNRKLGSVVELAQQERERPEDKAAQGCVEVRSARGHPTLYALRPGSPVA